jgi:adenylate cyclase
LDDFKSKLSTDAAHQLTLLALAYDSGFNSKTVFNTFFKRKVGVTPKAYWNQIKN